MAQDVVLNPSDAEALVEQMLRAAGVAAIFGPGTNIPAAARQVLAVLRSKRTAA